MKKVITYIIEIAIIINIYSCKREKSSLMEYQKDRKKNNIERTNDDSTNCLCAKPSFSEYLMVSPKVFTYYDFNEGFHCAIEKKKLNLVYFTGFGNVQSREMEYVIFNDNSIIEILKKYYVITSLFVDDRSIIMQKKDTLFDSNDTLTFKYLGEKSLYIMNNKFNEHRLPAFYIIDSTETQKSQPLHYTLSIDTFKLFLTNVLIK